MMIPESRTLGDLLDELSARYGDKDALIYRDSRISFKDWEQRANHLAKGLMHLGVKRGDRVGLLLKNSPEWFVVAFAAFKIGAIVVAINTWYKADDLKYVLDHAQVKVLFSNDRFLRHDYIGSLTEIYPELKRIPPDKFQSNSDSYLQHVVIQGNEKPKGAYLFEEIEQLRRSTAEDKLKRQTVKPEDIAYILYTSGTTARPKGVQLRHGGLIENGFNIGEREHLNDKDRLWLGVPLFFSFASANAIMAILTHGGSIAIQDHFDAGQALKIIEKTRATVYYGMPVMTKQLYEHPERNKYNLSSLTKGATIGSPDTIRQTIELVPHISNVYGATETYGNCCVMDGRAPIDKKISSQGKPLPGMDLKIVDPETLMRLPSGEVGEVCVKGYITPGYYEDPINNKKAFDSEGYYLTGDLGYLDDDGYFYYVSRIKDMIKTSGINVSPLEVEERIRQHEKVNDVHVVGIPDLEKGEVVAAIIVTKESCQLSEKEIIEYCKRRLPSYSVPRYVEFWDEQKIPRTPTGKVSKRDIKKIIVDES